MAYVKKPIVGVVPPTVYVSGPPGTEGPPGPPGTVTRFGTSAPLEPIGQEGDIFWDTTNHRIYQLVDGVYVLKEAITGGTGSDAHYLHTQSIPASTWIIQHALGKRPAVTVIDTAGDECEGQVKHDSVNQVTIVFSAPFAGVAFCN